MARKELTVEPRKVTGKKVAQLRRTGILPGNIFGHGIESQAVQIDFEQLQHTLHHATANEVLDLKVKGEGAVRPVVLHKLQRNPLNGHPIHADFYQVQLREKMRAEVPVVFVGNTEAIDTYNGVLVPALETIHVEALPLDIPASFEVDISKMRNLEDAFHVRDLKVTGNVSVLNDEDVVIAKVASPRVEEGEEPAEGPTATTEEAEGEESEEAAEAAEEASSEEK